MQIKLNITNKAIYTMIIITVLAILSIIVYAISATSQQRIPDPGHSADDILTKYGASFYTFKEVADKFLTNTNYLNKTYVDDSTISLNQQIHSRSVAEDDWENAGYCVDGWTLTDCACNGYDEECDAVPGERAQSSGYQKPTCWGGHDDDGSSDLYTFCVALNLTSS